MAKQRKTLKEP